LLARLDRFLALTRTTDFATVCFGLLDPRTGVFEYASAGHPPILLVEPSGDVRWLHDAASPPLYGEPRRGRPPASTALEPGSLLLLYTDGLIERRGELLEDGLERLARAAAGAQATPIDSVCDHLVTTLGVDSTRSDDLAILAIRLEPPGAPMFQRSFDARPTELRELRAAMR